MPLTIFSMLRPTASRRAIVARLARVLSRPVETPFTSLSTAPPLCLEAVTHLVNALVGLVGVVLRELRALFDLRQRRRGLLRGGGLLLRAAIDLADGGHDLARGARQFLDGRRQLFRRGADLLRPTWHRPSRCGPARRPSPAPGRRSVPARATWPAPGSPTGLRSPPQTAPRRRWRPAAAPFSASLAARSASSAPVRVSWLPSAILCMSSRSPSSVATTAAPAFDSLTAVSAAF